MFNFWYKKIVEEPPAPLYDSLEDYYMFIFKFLVMTHLLPLVYVLCHVMYLDYYDYYIEKYSGSLPKSHSDKFEQYFDLRESLPVGDLSTEILLDNRIYDSSSKFFFDKFIKIKQIILKRIKIITKELKFKKWELDRFILAQKTKKKKY